MKSPLCPKCETQHYSTQPCGKKPAVDLSEVRPVKRSPKVETVPPTPLSPVVHDGDEAPQGGRSTLTPAERQKLWRTTGDVEGKRKSNAERMRKSRENKPI